MKRAKQEARLQAITSSSKPGLTPSKLFQILPPDEARKRLRESSSRNIKITPNIPPSSKLSPRKPADTEELSDDMLATAVEAIEARALSIKG